MHDRSDTGPSSEHGKSIYALHDSLNCVYGTAHSLRLVPSNANALAYLPWYVTHPCAVLQLLLAPVGQHVQQGTLQTRHCTRAQGRSVQGRPGVFPTGIPHLVAAGTSTLLYPTA